MAAFVGIMVTEDEIDSRTGLNVSAGVTADMKTRWTLEAENAANAIAGFNFSDAFGTLNVDKKYVLTGFVVAVVAIKAITYDMSGYTNRTEAEDMINVLRDEKLFYAGIIREQSKEDFINAA